MQRFLVFFIGMIAVLIIAEAGLRFLGFVSKKNTDVPVRSLVKQQGKPFIILCLGNSFTKGVGAQPNMSYPAQLQRMCDEQMKKRGIVVINKGEVAQNSAELLGELRSNIKTYHPDLIILQTGQPNTWNHLRYTDYLKRMDKRASFSKQIYYYFRELLSESRILRLCVLFNEKLKVKRDQVRSSVAYREERDYMEAMDFVRITFHRLSIDKSFVVDQSMIKRSFGIFMEAIKQDPECALNFIAMASLYDFQGKYDISLKWFIKSLTVGRADDRDKIFGYQGLRRLRKINKGAHNDDINNKIDMFMDRYTKRNPDIAFQFLLLSDAEIMAWVESDMKEIVSIIQHEKILVVVQNYPKWFPVNVLILRVADELKLSCVDNYKIFQKKIVGGVSEEKLFVPDGHCNANGYALMAENVLHKIVAEGFLRSSGKE